MSLNNWESLFSNYTSAEWTDMFGGVFVDMNICTSKEELLKRHVCSVNFLKKSEIFTVSVCINNLIGDNIYLCGGADFVGVMNSRHDPYLLDNKILTEYIGMGIMYPENLRVIQTKRWRV